MRVVQFSGGKDSLACLYLYRDSWKDSDFCAAWVNTGAAYPEAEAFIRSFGDKLRLVEITTNQPEFIERNGFPSDVIPVAYTNIGHAIGLDSPFLISDYLSCCSHNIWQPMDRAMREIKATTIIRGQRLSEVRKSPLRDGHVENGVTYLYPLEDWSEQKVLDYLKEQDAPLPAYYATERTSRDCWSCTAYLDENKERIRNLPAGKRAIVTTRLSMIRAAVDVYRDYHA